MPVGIYEVQIVDAATGEERWIRVRSTSKEAAIESAVDMGETVGEARLIEVVEDAARPPSPPPPTIIVQNDSSQSWHPGTAAVLSIIPGAGHLYKGQILSGVVWFFFVLLCYLFCFVPGLVAHVIVIWSAAHYPTENTRKL